MKDSQKYISIGRVVGVLLTLLGSLIIIYFAPSFISFIHSPENSTIINHLKIFSQESLHITGMENGARYEFHVSSGYLSYYLAMLLNIIVFLMVSKIAIAFLTAGVKLLGPKTSENKKEQAKE